MGALPLGAGNCSAACPVNTNRFFHYDVEIGSHDPLSKIVDTYNAPDGCGLAPGGWSQWLRPGATRYFIVITDDGPMSKPGKINPNTWTAEHFEAQLFALSPARFGDASERAYTFHSIVGLAENNPGLPVSSTDDAYWARQAEWHTALYDAGFFGLSWPKRYGGHELPTVFDVILDEELAAAGAPPRPSLGYLVQGIDSHGSDAIKDRFLPGLINGTERWCQGFSEPDAGSDLASLRTTAVPDGDEFVINGHKIWTNYSDVADWCILLARTDPDVPKHKGLSAFARHSS